MTEREPPPPGGPASERRRSPWIEIVVTYGLVSGAVLVLARVVPFAWVRDNLHAFVGFVFLFAATRAVRWADSDFVRFGISLGGLFGDVEDHSPGGVRGVARDLWRALPSAAREAGIAVAIAMVVLPPFTLGFYFWHAPRHPLVASAGTDPFGFAAAQLLVVALPEEVFFRGWLQTRLADLYPARRSVAGVSLPLRALLLQAVAFGALHVLADLSPARMAVVFPGLLFGVIRQWRKGVGATLVLHAICNVYADFLLRGWLS